MNKLCYAFFYTGKKQVVTFNHHNFLLFLNFV